MGVRAGLGRLGPHLDLREPLPSARNLGDELDPLADLVAKAF
jgi:hypothetical protein